MITPSTSLAERQKKGSRGRVGVRRTNSTEVEQRLSWIIQLIMAGYIGPALTMKVQNDLGVSQRVAQMSIVKAREEIAEAFAVERRDLACQLLGLYFETYTEAKKHRQFSAAVGALAGITRLVGLETPRS